MKILKFRETKYLPPVPHWHRAKLGWGLSLCPLLPLVSTPLCWLTWDNSVLPSDPSDHICSAGKLTILKNWWIRGPHQVGGWLQKRRTCQQPRSQMTWISGGSPDMLGSLTVPAKPFSKQCVLGLLWAWERPRSVPWSWSFQCWALSPKEGREGYLSWSHVNHSCNTK